METSEYLAELFARLFFVDAEDAPEEYQALLADLTAAVEGGSFTLEQAEARLVTEAKGATGAIAAAYQFLTGGVPSEAGFAALLSAELAGDFGQFNFENRFINQFNALAQGNPTATATFNLYVAADAPGDADLIASVSALYDAMTNTTGADRDAAIAYLTRPEALEFYRGVAAERILDGSNPNNLSLDQAAAIVALGSIANILVREGVSGLGGDVSALLGLLADDMSPLDPTLATDITDLGGISGQTFVLTEGADIIPGLIGSEGTTDNSGDDLILSGTVNAAGVNTLGAADNLNGGDGFDTLRMIDDIGGALVPNTQSVERFEAQSTAGGTTTVNMVNAVGAEQAWNYRSTGNIEYNNVQNDVAVGIFDSNTRNEVTFESGVDFGGDLDLVAQRAGTSGNFATIRVNTDSFAAIETLNISSLGGADVTNYLEIDVDSAPGNGAVASPASLNIVGDAGLVLREENGQGETDFLTSINSTGLTGSLDLDLSDNDEDFVFVGGNGNTTLDASGNGDVDITTGAGDDFIDVSGSGEVTVNAGAGDDYIDLDGGAAVGDSVDGGDGVDTIGIDDDLIQALTANGDFEAGISNIEKLRITGEINDDQDVTVNLGNLNDIDYVISEGTEAGESEIQRIDLDNAISQGVFSIAGVEIDVAAGDSVNDIAAKVLARADDIKAADPNIADIRTGPGDDITIEYFQSAGDVPLVEVLNLLETGVSLSGVTEAVPGDQSETEVFTIEVNAGTGITPSSVEFSNSGVVGAITVTENQTIDEVGAEIVSSYNANGSRTYTASYNAATNLLTFTALTPGARTNIVATDTANVLAEPGAVSEGSDGTPEQQTFTVDSGATADGYVLVGGVKIAVSAGMSAEEVGGAIAAAESAIIAANPSIASVDYNTVGSVVTIVYDEDAAPPANIALGDTDTNDTAIDPAFTSNTGEIGGLLTLNYVAPGGTLELLGANDGVTNVVVAGADGDSDEFNIVLANDVDHDGVVVIDNIEILNVMTEADGSQSYFGVIAEDVVTINVTGMSGVDFGTADLLPSDLANLETVNAADLDIANDEAGVWIETDNVDGTTFIGSVGRDWFVGDVGDDVMNGGAGNDTLDGNEGIDTINGGDGDDFIDGGLGADILTGGAGVDTFYYNNALDSSGADVDVITDFIVGEDLIDLSGLGLGGVSFVGNVNSLAAANTALSGGGGLEAVYDSSVNQLYVDVDGDGVVDAMDMIIELTGVAALANDGSDFV